MPGCIGEQATRPSNLIEPLPRWSIGEVFELSFGHTLLGVCAVDHIPADILKQAKQTAVSALLVRTGTTTLTTYQVSDDNHLPALVDQCTHPRIDHLVEVVLELKAFLVGQVWRVPATTPLGQPPHQAPDFAPWLATYKLMSTNIPKSQTVVLPSESRLLMVS